MANQTELAHRTLIKVLKENEHLLSINTPHVRKHTGSSSWSDIDTRDINNAVALIVDFLHLTGGSVGGFNLYELLQTYFKDSVKRQKINELLDIS